MGRRSKNKQKRRPPNRRRIAIAVGIGLVCQLVFLFAWRGVLAEYYARRAQAAVAESRSDRAVKSARRALSLVADHGYASMFEGMAHWQSRRYARAAPPLRLAMRTVAHRGRPVRYLAMSEEQNGEVASAIRHYREALAIEPLPSGTPGELRGRLGRLFLNNRRWAEGAAQFRRIVGDRPESRFPFDALTLAWEHFGARDLATACACVLLLSERHADRACTHLERMADGPERRRLAVAALREVRNRYEPGVPARTAVERLLRKIADEK